MWDEIINPFPNLNDCTIEVWEWIINITTGFTMDVMIYPCLRLKFIYVSISQANP